MDGSVIKQARKVSSLRDLVGAYIEQNPFIALSDKDEVYNLGECKAAFVKAISVLESATGRYDPPSPNYRPSDNLFDSFLKAVSRVDQILKALEGVETGNKDKKEADKSVFSAAVVEGLYRSMHAVITVCDAGIQKHSAGFAVK